MKIRSVPTTRGRRQRSRQLTMGFSPAESITAARSAKRMSIATKAPATISTIKKALQRDPQLMRNALSSPVGIGLYTNNTSFKDACQCAFTVPGMGSRRVLKMQELLEPLTVPEGADERHVQLLVL